MKNKQGQFNFDRKFKKDLWKKLEVELPPYSWYQTKTFRYTTVAIVLVVLISGSGTGAYAYGSNEVVDGNRLYPLKQQIEKLEERLQKSPSAKAKHYLKIMERREKELVKIKKFRKSELRTIEDINKMHKKLETTREWVKNKKIKDPKLRRRIEMKLEQGDTILKQRKAIINQQNS